MDEHHYRQRLGGWLFGCDDVEGETVLAAGLVPADAHHGVAALLRSTVGKRVAVPYARPGCAGCGARNRSEPTGALA